MNYYSEKLSAEKLRLCYLIAPPRINRYLTAEIEYVRNELKPGQRVLEIGCGYGRVFRDIRSPESILYGIDISFDSLSMARDNLHDLPNVQFAVMNAVQLGFKNHSFDTVLCIQNGISAFHENPQRVMSEAVRVTKEGGVVLFSGYSEKIWDDRLEWFIRQSEYGLVGKIDFSATGNGNIVCRDGFSATTFRPEDFTRLADSLGLSVSLTEVDDSCLFCRIDVPVNPEP